MESKNELIRFFRKNGYGHEVDQLLQDNEGDTNPYHNNLHCLRVAYACYEGGIEASLSQEEMDIVVLAGIFHDYNHSGGKLFDADNIKIAISQMQVRVSAQYSHLVIRIAATIERTEFGKNGFKYDSSALNQLEKILRDADLMTLFYLDWFETVTKALAKEIGIEVNANYIQNQIAFVSSIQWMTEFAKKKASDHIPMILEHLRELDH